jgi:GxxExxY protein
MNDVVRRRKRFTTERTENTEKTLLLFSVNSVASVVNLLSMTERERLNGITKSIIGAAIQVHSALGPGLLESAYEACLAFELERRQLRVERQKPLPLIYEQVKLDCGYRIDLLVEGSVVVEIKSVDAVAPIHEAQVITYLKLSGCKLALLINFNVPLLKDGIRRFVNGEI